MTQMYTGLYLLEFGMSRPGRTGQVTSGLGELDHDSASPQQQITESVRSTFEPRTKNNFQKCYIKDRKQ